MESQVNCGMEIRATQSSNFQHSVVVKMVAATSTQVAVVVSLSLCSQNGAILVAGRHFEMSTIFIL